MKIHVFDITNWQGADLRLQKLCERLAFLKDFQEATTAARLGEHFDFPPVFFREKEAVFNKILASGGEGVVLKNLNYHYEDSNSRSRHGWIKVKRQIELEAYVSGFEPGRAGSRWETKVASLIFSVRTESSHQAIAKVSNLPWFFRKDISLYDRTTGVVKLDIGVYGKVAHICGLELSQRAFRLVHPKIVHWRTDLSQEQCFLRYGGPTSSQVGGDR